MEPIMKIHTLFVGAALLALTATATAGTAEELGSEMEAFANIEAYLGDGTSAETLAEARASYGADCDALVAKAKKKLKGDDELVAWRLGDHPKAHKVGDKYAVKVSDLAWFCDRYRSRLDELSLASFRKSVTYAETFVQNGLSDEDKKNIRGGGQEQRKRGDECAALVEQMTGKGATVDPEVKCEQLGKYADLLDAEWKIASKEFEKPFKDAGITGDRLDWFVYYGPGIEVWYLKGCKGETSLAKIKKAKLLFQWLTDGDGIITIRRFQWKGDKLVKQTEKRYLTEKAAYRGCK
jgi:hypothetical protein